MHEQNKLFSFGDFFTKTYYSGPLLITVIIQMSQQFSGINAVSFYSTQIFAKAVLDADWSKYCTILLNIVEVSSIFVCMVLVERTGRKTLLLMGMCGMCGMCIATAGLTLVLTLIDNVKEYIKLLLYYKSHFMNNVVD